MATMQKTGGCHCHEAPSVECEPLRCPERPSFYCGQFLTDQDLTALAEWVRQKFRLRRLIDGWGVVCGLQVSLDSSRRRPRLVVAPGYAIDCLGNDIVVCEDAPPPALDLAEHCTATGTSANARSLAPVWERIPLSVRELLRRQGIAETPWALDVYVRPSDEPFARQPVAQRQRIEGRPECRDTRIRETASVYVHDPLDLETACCEKAFDRCWRIAEDFLALAEDAERADHTGREAPTQQQQQQQQQQRRQKARSEQTERQRGERLKAWLLRELAKSERRLVEFGFLPAMIGRLSGSEFAKPETFVPILFWLVLDCRIGLRLGRCGPCEENCRCAQTGVRLARVWLRRDENGCCEVLYIDNNPPWRRLLGPDLSAPDGEINLTSLIWLPFEDAAQQFKNATEYEVDWVLSPKEEHAIPALRLVLQRPQERPLCVRPDEPLALFTLAGRVVGFVARSALAKLERVREPSQTPPEAAAP